MPRTSIDSSTPTMENNERKLPPEQRLLQHFRGGRKRIKNIKANQHTNEHSNNNGTRENKFGKT